MKYTSETAWSWRGQGPEISVTATQMSGAGLYGNEHILKGLGNYQVLKEYITLVNIHGLPFATRVFLVKKY